MDKKYWEEYYSRNSTPFAPSLFSQFALGWLDERKTLLELGCGNARDAVFFHKNGLDVTAIDQVDKEVDLLNSKYAQEHLRFISDDFTNITRLDSTFDYIYSRFTIHSINYQQEKNTLQWIKEHLNADGLLLIEVRSIKDELFKEGTNVGDEDNAKITDHYRRFIRFERFKNDLKKLDLDIKFSIEDKGLAPYGKEDPVVIRIIAQNKTAR